MVLLAKPKAKNFYVPGKNQHSISNLVLDFELVHFLFKTNNSGIEVMDFLIAFVLFIVFFVVLHILLFTKWKDVSAKIWKATDYLWFSLAVLGLVGVASRFHQQESKQQIHYLEQELQIEYASQQSWILVLMNTDLQTALLTIEQSPDEDGSIRKNVSVPVMSRYHLSNIQLCFANRRPYIDNLETLNSEIEKVKESGKYKNVASEAEHLIQRAIHIEKELKELRKNSSLSLFEIWIIILWPYLLAMALALRITKVTAEVFVLSKRHNKYQQT